MVTRRTDAARAARTTSRRDRRYPTPTRGRTDTRAPAVPLVQHNGPDIEHDSSEDRTQSPDPLSNCRAQTDLNDGPLHTQVGDVISHAASSAQLPTTRLRKFKTRAANDIPRTPQKEPESDSDSEPGPTAYEIMERIHPATTPGQVAFVYDYDRRQASSTRSQSTMSDRSSQLRSAEMLALATSNGNADTSAGDKLFMRVAKRAIALALRSFYPGVVLGPIAMQMIMFALRAGRKITGTTLRALVYTLRTLIPGVLVTVRAALTAEKAPEGSDHAPIPGAYPITASATSMRTVLKWTSLRCNVLWSTALWWTALRRTSR